MLDGFFSRRVICPQKLQVRVIFCTGVVPVRGEDELVPVEMMICPVPGFVLIPGAGGIGEEGGGTAVGPPGVPETPADF